MGLPDKSTLSHPLPAAWPHPAKQNNGEPTAAPARTIAQLGQGRRRSRTWSQPRKTGRLPYGQGFDLNLENGIV